LTLSNNVISGSIADATTSTKGIASFNSTNFTASSGAVNTIQDIATSASPQFTALTLTNALTAANGGTGIKGGTAPNGTLLIGNGSGYALNTLTAGSGVSIANGAGSITINATGTTYTASGTLPPALPAMLSR